MISPARFDRVRVRLKPGLPCPATTMADMVVTFLFLVCAADHIGRSSVWGTSSSLTFAALSKRV